MSLFSKKTLLAISFHGTDVHVVCMDADHQVILAQSAPAADLQKIVAGISPKPEGAILVLPDAQCFVRRFPVDNTLKDGAVEGAIVEQAKKSIPVDHDQVYFDFTSDGLYASALKSTIDEIKKVLDTANIPLTGVSVEGLGLGTSLLGQVPATVEGAKAFLIVTIGDDTTAINAFNANLELLFSSIVPFSGGHFTQTIIKSLAVQGASATVPVSLQITADPAQQSVLQMALQSIILEISKAATYAETTLQQPIGTIVLAGELAMIPGIDSYFSSLLNKPTVIGTLEKGNATPLVFAGEVGVLVEVFGSAEKAINLLRHGNQKTEVRSEKIETSATTPHPSPLPEGEGSTPSAPWKKVIGIVFFVAALAGLGFIVYKYLFLAM